jgi:hypothetical protein
MRSHSVRPSLWLLTSHNAYYALVKRVIGSGGKMRRRPSSVATGLLKAHSRQGKQRKRLAPLPGGAMPNFTTGSTGGATA